MLGDSKVSDIKQCILEVRRHNVSGFPECLIYFFSYQSPIRCCTQESNNIFKYKKLRSEMAYYFDITFKQIVPIIVTHSMFIANTSGQRIRLTRRPSNYYIHSSVAYQFLQPYVRAIYRIIKASYKFFCTLDIKSYNCIIRIFIAPFRPQAMPQCCTGSILPFNRRQCAITTRLQKALCQSPTTRK